jgi:hypothetical protein
VQLALLLLFWMCRTASCCPRLQLVAHSGTGGHWPIVSLGTRSCVRMLCAGGLQPQQQ